MAYGLSRTKRRARVAVHPVPGALHLLFNAGIIPNYLLVKKLGLLDTYPSLILPGVISAFNLVVIRNFFMDIPAGADRLGAHRRRQRVADPVARSCCRCPRR